METSTEQFKYEQSSSYICLSTGAHILLSSLASTGILPLASAEGRTGPENLLSMIKSKVLISALKQPPTI